MAKAIKAIVKVQAPAGQANPAPPLGPALGQHGINIQDFCQKFNEATKQFAGDIIPVEITIYTDRSFNFKLKTPLTSALIRKAAGIEKGSAEGAKKKVGKITREDLRKIAERKMPDLNAYDIEAAEKIVSGTARNMGVEIIQ